MAKNKTTIPLQIVDLESDGFHPLVQISLLGKGFILVVDTGASKTAFDRKLLEAAGFTELTHTDKLSTGLGTNSMVSFIAMIHDLHIGKLLIDRFDAAVLDLSAINLAYTELGHPSVLGVLGGDILMKYKAVIDYGKSVLLLHT